MRSAGLPTSFVPRTYRISSSSLATPIFFGKHPSHIYKIKPFYTTGSFILVPSSKHEVVCNTYSLVYTYIYTHTHTHICIALAFGGLWGGEAQLYPCFYSTRRDLVLRERPINFLCRMGLGLICARGSKGVRFNEKGSMDGYETGQHSKEQCGMGYMIRMNTASREPGMG